MAKKLAKPAAVEHRLHDVGDPDNPRVISEEALAGLAASVHDFGDISGIVHNRRTGQLVCGHQRVTALMRAGAVSWRELDADHGEIVDPQTGERFPVRLVDWDETKQRLANLAANNPHIAGEFTAAALKQLRELEEQAAFSALRLDELQSQLLDQFPQDDTPAGDDGGEGGDHAPPAEPFTRLGDMWIMGEHRLVCGDATKAVDVEALLEKERPALGLHDPPYGIGIQDSEGRIGGAKKEGSQSKAISRAKAYPMIAGDDQAFDPGHLLDTGVTVVIWGANHFANLLPASAAWICWDKTLELGSTDFSDGELAWVSRGGRLAIFRMLWRGLIREGKTEDGPVRVHPTQKPIALYRWIIEQYTEPGELVYDAYGGSGPTLLAAEALGRRARVMELSPAYCDVIVARWEEKTGQRALLRRGGVMVERATSPSRPPPSSSDESDDTLAF